MKRYFHIFAILLLVVSCQDSMEKAEMYPIAGKWVALDDDGSVSHYIEFKTGRYYIYDIYNSKMGQCYYSDKTIWNCPPDNFNLRIEGWYSVEDGRLYRGDSSAEISFENGILKIGTQEYYPLKYFEGDLSSLYGPANCYIVSCCGTYSFPAVKGCNSSLSVGVVARVEVLWESFGNSKVPKVGDLISTVACSDGEITFKINDTFKEGNAVIAAKNTAGTILWSWHIWLTDQPQAQVYYNNAGTMMDRNLGATSATPGDVGALGLLYQWGRKDPFLGSSSISSDEEAKSTITWPSAVSTSSSRGTVSYVTANPTTFVYASSSSYDWHYSSRDNSLWTTSENNKSIYDPCPAGWRVPDGRSNGVWSKALGSISSFYYTYDSTKEGMNFSGKFGSASTIWYPASGYRSNYDGSLYYVGEDGGYWSASPYDNGAYFLCFGDYGSVYPYPSNDRYRAYGQSVRCLHE